MTSILIATPIYGTPETGTVSARWAQCLFYLARETRIDLLSLDSAMYSTDLVRCRSRMVRHFLEGTWSHLWFWDADVIDKPVSVGANLSRLLRCDRDIVGIPYPKKTAAPEGEGMGDHYSFQLAEASGLDEDGCVEVEHMALGFMLVRRSVLQAMVDHYADELAWDDEEPSGRQARTVALFQLLHASQGTRTRLLSEDYSFCLRASRLGFAIHMYLGEGSPMHHVGNHMYQGNRSALVTPSEQ